jgi:hypothetical protein
VSWAKSVPAARNAAARSGGAKCDRGEEQFRCEAARRRLIRLGRGTDQVPHPAGWFNLRATLANQAGALQGNGECDSS